MCPLCVIRCLFEITVASYWAFEHSGLNWGRSVYVHTITAQSVRIILSRIPDVNTELCFTNTIVERYVCRLCFCTQCIRNQHFQFFYLK